MYVSTLVKMSGKGDGRYSGKEQRGSCGGVGCRTYNSIHGTRAIPAVVEMMGVSMDVGGKGMGHPLVPEPAFLGLPVRCESNVVVGHHRVADEIPVRDRHAITCAWQGIAESMRIEGNVAHTGKEGHGQGLRAGVCYGSRAIAAGIWKSGSLRTTVSDHTGRMLQSMMPIHVGGTGGAGNRLSSPRSKG